MLDYAAQTRQPKRDAVIVLLSVKAGLRSCEIAGLQWSMVTTDNGDIADVIDIRSAIAKKGSGRRIPMHLTLQTRIGRTVAGANIRHSYCRIKPRRANATQQHRQLVRRRCFTSSTSTAAHRIQADAPSSPPPPKTCIEPGAACATCNCSPVISQSKQPSDTSTATPKVSANWSACCDLSADTAQPASRELRRRRTYHGREEKS